MKRRAKRASSNHLCSALLFDRSILNGLDVFRYAFFVVYLTVDRNCLRSSFKLVLNTVTTSPSERHLTANSSFVSSSLFISLLALLALLIFVEEFFYF